MSSVAEFSRFRSDSLSLTSRGLSGRQALLPALAALIAGAAVAASGRPLQTVVLALLGILLWFAWRSPADALTGVTAVALLLPFAVVPLDFGMKLSFLNLAVLAAIGQGAIDRIRARDPAPLDPFLFGPVFIFGLLVLAAAVWGLNFARPSLFELRKVGEFLMSLSLFALVLLLIRRRTQIRTFVIAAALLGVAAALAGLLLYFAPQDLARAWLGAFSVFDYPSGETALRFVHDDPRGTLRAVGLAVDPNLLGAVCALTAALLLPLFCGGHSLSMRVAAGAGLAVVVATLYLTYSRNALLALGGWAALLALLRYRYLIPLGAAGLLLLALLPQMQFYLERLAAGFLRQDQATLMRLAEYANAARIVQAYPWTGLGFFGTPSLALAAGTVSMVPLSVAVAMGLPAMLLFLWIWGRPLCTFLSVHARWRGHALEPCVLGLGGATLVLGLTGLFDHFYVNLLYPHMSALYWILLGMLTQALRLGPDADPQPAEPLTASAA